MSMTVIGPVTWPGPVGIAAGLIKGSAAFLDLATKADSLEIGSITKEPLPGNDGQTVWRYPNEHAIRHNTGMPNPGSIDIVHQLRSAQEQIQIPWGLNLAVTPGIPDTPHASVGISQTASNILAGGLKPDWLTLNVSSPDTDDTVEMLSEPQRVWALIQTLKPLLALQKIPLWIKIGATLPKSYYSQLGQIFIEENINALICSNAIPDTQGNLGGWCGAPVAALSYASIWELQQVTNSSIPIVSVGGILDGKDLHKRLTAGTSAVLIASALLLRGRDAAQVLHPEYELLPS